NAFTPPVPLPHPFDPALATNAFVRMNPQMPVNPAMMQQQAMMQQMQMQQWQMQQMQQAMAYSAMVQASMPQMPAADLQNSAAMPGVGHYAGQVKDASQLLTVLHESAYPSQREWAVENLGEVNGPRDANVVSELVNAAHDDPAPTVRVACVRSLVKMNANTA